VTIAIDPEVLELSDLRNQVGRLLGPGPWHEVDQDRVDLFADATGDHQWIHVDPERAAGTAFGGTIAHGYLTLSLLPLMQAELRTFGGAAMTVNYGLDKVRFPAPVAVGSRIRLTLKLLGTDERHDGSTILHTEATIESDTSERPACIAHTLTLLKPPV
jgi:acyl dehydratase